jgi:hypothetical protein
MKAVGLSNCGHGSGQLAVAESHGRRLIDVGQPKRTVEVLEESLARTEGSKMPDQTRQLLKLANQKLEELELWLLTPVHKATIPA